jgi:CheY-like chemotaxis protein
MARRFRFSFLERDKKMDDNVILVVEDDDNDLLLIRRALEKARVGNTVKVAHDGAEALEMLLHGPGRLPKLPTVVLLDMKLPRVDGLEVLETLRGDERTRTLPVVILTSSDEQEDLLKSYRLGVNSYVRKPIDFSQFQETIGLLGLYWAIVNRIPRPE